MEKYNTADSIKIDAELAALLKKRKAPLSADALSQVLQDLTWHLSADVVFFLAAFPKQEKAAERQIQATDIDRVDIMYATDDERYLPVFTEPEKLRKFKPECREGEFVYLAGKQDLLDFLHANEKVAACVINPNEDDLLLYRTHLLNMIRVEKER